MTKGGANEKKKMKKELAEKVTSKGRVSSTKLLVNAVLHPKNESFVHRSPTSPTIYALS